MTTSHTPGPWIRVFGQGYGVIVSTVTNDEIYHLCDDATYEANKNLEAAGPELLAALIAFLPGAEAMGWNTEQAKAAIAKATGQILPTS